MMKRYFLEFAYNGSRFHGFQRQPQQMSVQQKIEEALSTVLRQEIQIVGCGRTDTGVHALQYFAHFDAQGELPQRIPFRLNSLLGSDFAVYRLLAVEAEAHARYDACSRAYVYQLSLRPDPFRQETAFHFPRAQMLDPQKMQAAAALLLDYEAFFPFCKTNSDVKHYGCQLSRSEWDFSDPYLWRYEVQSNRFLRGMIRLIVGACLNVGLGKLSLAELKTAMDQQKALKRAYSVPPQGLFLKDIQYPYIQEDLPSL
ncbi:tRNA pseudouridine synthase A [Saprospira grandis]|uniref:tRNA pseudouridine synthase A n=1 Tax=Saprospira grandis TaxID=1008 RepID=UPI0022DCF645|nr:tRNA pseudouridine synthase A [Saprospira grandis]WBM74480.1 tRNA pseudouridine(38-40) synthase TruA [Saprospira grandis]